MNLSPFRPAVILLVLVLSTGCFKRFYQTNSVATVDTTIIQESVSRQRYFIVHTGDDHVYALTNAKLTNETLEGYTDSLPNEHGQYLNPIEAKNNRVKARDQQWALNETHAYTKSSIPYHQHVQLPLTSIYRLDVYGADKEANARSTAGSILGISVITGALIVGAIVAANSPTFSLGNWMR